MTVGVVRRFAVCLVIGMVVPATAVGATPSWATVYAGGPSTVIYVHGGGWRTGDREHWEAAPFAPVAAELQAEGFTVIAVDYPLAPAHPFPAAPNALLNHVAWVKANATVLGIDPNRIALLGISAGGNLAAKIATSAAVQGVVTYSAPTRLAVLYTALRAAGQYRRASLMPQYLGCWPCLHTSAQASPIPSITAASPPMLIANGSSEFIPVAQAQALATRLGSQAALQIYPTAAHGGALRPFAWTDTIAFLHAVLEGGA
jgi:acetyl esterase